MNPNHILLLVVLLFGVILVGIVAFALVRINKDEPRPEDYVELSTLRPTGRLTKEEIAQRIREGRVAEIRE